MNSYLKTLKISVVQNCNKLFFLCGAFKSFTYFSVVSSPCLAHELPSPPPHVQSVLSAPLSPSLLEGPVEGWKRVKEMAREGQWGEVAKWTRVLVENFPEHPKTAKAWFKRGFALEMLNRDQEALDCFSKCATLQQDPILSSMSHFAMGNTLRKLGNPAESIAAYHRALSQHATPKIYCNLAHLLQDLGQHQEALHVLNTALVGGRAVGVRDVHLLRGMSLTELKQFHAALWSFERARLLEGERDDHYVKNLMRDCAALYKEDKIKRNS